MDLIWFLSFLSLDFIFLSLDFIVLSFFNMRFSFGIICFVILNEDIVLFNLQFVFELVDDVLY